MVHSYADHLSNIEKLKRNLRQEDIDFIDATLEKIAILEDAPIFLPKLLYSEQEYCEYRKVNYTCTVTKTW